ncbi:MAG: hypothetical protein CL607_11610 [Anaerolineaceae bacterium]|nr:hypothetical protein [Anaerolineaceae bacterium]
MQILHYANSRIKATFIIDSVGAYSSVRLYHWYGHWPNTHRTSLRGKYAQMPQGLHVMTL